MDKQTLVNVIEMLNANIKYFRHTASVLRIESSFFHTKAHTLEELRDELQKLITNDEEDDDYDVPY